MGPSASAWRAARVRFWESGRSRQTPVALDLGDGWRTVSILGEELVAGADPAEPVARRWRLAGEDGALYVLAPHPAGGWRVRAWGRGGAKV
ncbi:MAG: hypothetical protein KQH53_03665 [Desulfarculaceae bacterium]|nr:hypothetical protein [Desulfarculaceae bacterium]